MIRTLLALVVLLLGAASAEICTGELGLDLEPARLEASPTGVDAARLLRRAVELVEPALPRLDWFGEAPLPADAEGYGEATYLQQRSLLPDGWQPGTLDAVTWSEMVAGFTAWYGLDPEALDRPDTVADLVADLGGALERISRAVRPVALVASDPRDGTRVSFLGVIWNWSVYPRLLVVRPRGEVSLADGPASILPQLGTCAVRLENWVYAPEPTARRLFQANTDARMVVVGSSPERLNAWPREVSDGEEEAYFGFDHPEVADAEVYSVVFIGPQPGPATLVGLLPRVRTNLSPRGLLRFMQTPP